jgi:hypothetical protein
MISTLLTGVLFIGTQFVPYIDLKDGVIKGVTLPKTALPVEGLSTKVRAVVFFIADEAYIFNKEELKIEKDTEK